MPSLSETFATIIPSHLYFKRESQGTIYLGSPYTGTSAEQESRYRLATMMFMALASCGYRVFSPITMTHCCADFPIDGAAWERFDRPFLDHCKCLFIVKQQGWRESKGLAQEISNFESRGLPIVGLEPTKVQLGIVYLGAWLETYAGRLRVGEP